MGRSAMGLGMGQQNRSTMRELVSELRDEGASRQAREKFLRWELESDEREDGEMKNKIMKKKTTQYYFIPGAK